MSAVTESVASAAVMASLNKMLRSSWFDICTIDNIGKVLGVRPAGQAYDVLRTLHCVNYSDMPREVLDALPSLIIECIGVEPTFQFQVATPPQETPPEPQQERRGLMKRLGLAR